MTTSPILPLQRLLGGTVPALAFLINVLLWAPASPAATDLREYDVELVVFEIRNPEPQNEFLPLVVDLQIPEQSIEFDSAAGLRDAARQGFKPLKADQGALREVVDRLNRSSRYRIVLYSAWRQPGLPFETAIPVRIHGGTDYTGRFEPLRRESAPLQGWTISSQPVAPAPDKPQQQEEVDGTITVSLQRYLHVNAHLVFREPLTAPTPPPEPEEQSAASAAQTESPRQSPTIDLGGLASEPSVPAPGQTYLQPYTLKEQRRMRSREIHFFDNPRFGLITLITPYEPQSQD